jgi:hypothetical protein
VHRVLTHALHWDVTQAVLHEHMNVTCSPWQGMPRRISIVNYPGPCAEQTGACVKLAWPLAPAGCVDTAVWKYWAAADTVDP